MDLRLLIFPLLVFLGGCCYGPSSPTIKLAYAAGYSWTDVVMSQYFYGWLILFVIVAGLFILRFIRKQPTVPGKNPRPLLRSIPGLALAGTCIALVTVTYCLSLQTVPAYISVILLFQFTWMGVLIQAIIEQRLPEPKMILAVVILVIGTFLALGFAGLDGPLDPVGVIFGLLSALLYAMYMFILGRFEIGMHPLNRSFLILSYALLLLTFLFTPAYFMQGTFVTGIWQYGIILGSIGCILPMCLFAIAAPRISTGATIWHWPSGSMTRRCTQLDRDCPTAWLEMNKKDAAKLGIADGEKVLLSSRRGEVAVAARVMEDIKEGVFFMPFHFIEARANLVTNTAYDPVSRTPEYKVCAVKVTKQEA
ncbi:molybdopterin dinucleotide binding domain-containing protein [uncultured Methanocorpusculum sp.]|nr:molybdopterin dinucleotide binding domain-containing protein [uncultured Methanocorpusculum sp.]